MILNMASPLHFLPSQDAPVSYMQRTREYYAALGYHPPYEWAHYAKVPWTPLRKPLPECSVTIVTTAAPFQPDKGDQGPGAPYNAAAKFYTVYTKSTAQDPDLRISHVAIDRKHTMAADAGAYFPLKQLRRLSEAGRTGPVASYFYGLPTNRSQRATLESDCPELVRRCQADGVDAVILVPNCPVCHQSVSLAARMLEENGIATVIMGCAKDIAEYAGVPRFLFSDFPLGNAAGRDSTQTHRSSRLCSRFICWSSRPLRARRCGRRSSGALIRTGSSITAISSA